MKKRFVNVFMSLLLAAVLLAPNLAVNVASAQPAAGNADAVGHFVRIPADAAKSLTSLAPRVDVDYGAFRWLVLNDSDYARLKASTAEFVDVPEAATVRVGGYAFDPLVDGEPNLPANQRVTGDGPALRLVQFVGPIQDAWLEDLSASGLDVLQYYPYNTFLVWGTAAQAESLAARSFFRWSGAFHPGYKVSASLANASGLIENVAITFYNDGAVDSTLARLTANGGVYIQSFPAQPDQRFFTAIYKLDASRLAEVSRLNTVWAVEFSSARPGFDDENGAQIISGNYTAGTPYTGYFTWLAEKGVTGDGITWADVDTGLNGNHPDIAGRTVVYVSYPGGGPANVDDGAHGSHTAGAIFGDPRTANGGTGITDPNGFYWGLGAAPEADLVVQNALAGTNWPPTGGWQLLSKDSVLNGAAGSSNSWFTGASGSQGYSAAARTHDFMVRDANFDTTAIEPIIMVFSAGNAGPSGTSMTEPKEAKNLITVGASDNYPRSGSSINGLASFSSRGPAWDGRLLPNVTAPGVQTASFNGSNGNNCGSSVPGAGSSHYNYCQGTSMAAPFVSGASALIADWWEQENGVIPSPAMTKALLINGAADMFGGTNVNGHIPNNNQGWGRVNLDNVIRNGEENIYNDQAYVFGATGQTWTISFGVADPTKPLKISLVWGDAPGAVAANPALVNNLDLTVVNGANTYKGNVFSGGWSATGGSADNLNNIENVYIQNPAGNATITINAINIAGDGVPGNADTTDQDFALVCYNCILGSDFTLSANPTTQSVCAPDPAAYDLTIGKIYLFDDEVTLTAYGAPAHSAVEISPNLVTPPAASVLTVTSPVTETWGLYTIDIVGESVTQVHTATVSLELFTALPGISNLLTPADNTSGVGVRPTFTWSTVAQGKTYDIEVATDMAFTNIVASAAGLTAPTFTPAADLARNTIHYWRVTVHNTCGESVSAVARFLTIPTAGQCSLGTVPSSLYSYGFESGNGGWQNSGGIGNTWILQTTRKHTGAFAFKASEPATVSDQWLVSPEITIPADQHDVILDFWNYRKLQSGCSDGGILEVSTDGGSTWEQLEAEILLGGYTGQINSASNPLNGMQAWCSSPASWSNVMVSLDAYIGETINLRYRLGTDNAVAVEGWYIDDVSIESCVPAAALGESSQQSIAAGESVTYTFTLENDGPADVFDLELSGNTWPTTILGSEVVTLTQGMSATILVRVDVPQAATGSDTFTLQAVSRAVPGVWMAATGTTSVIELWRTFLPLVIQVTAP